MEEPPTTFDNPPEPPDYVDVNASSSFELDAEIESHVESVEMRDAEQFSDRVERTHRGPRQTRRHSHSRRAQRRPSRQRRPDRDDTDEQDEQTRGRFGSPRACLLLTVALTVISFISVVVLFATNAGAPTATPAIDTTPRKPTTDSYISIRPAPPPPTIPRSSGRRSASPNATPTDSSARSRDDGCNPYRPPHTRPPDHPDAALYLASTTARRLLTRCLISPAHHTRHAPARTNK